MFKIWPCLLNVQCLIQRGFDDHSMWINVHISPRLFDRRMRIWSWIRSLMCLRGAGGAVVIHNVDR